MSELSKYLVEQILLEDDNPIKKTVVIYVGRFQPFHKGHHGTYQHLVKKFGKDNVFIGTSNKTDKLKSPFKFNEKVKIMTTMFGIPKSKIHQVKNPYKPTEILKKFNEDTTAFITVVGEKDKARLGGKYFQPYKGEPTEGYRDRGYVYSAPMAGNSVSGTEVRNGLSNGSDEQKKDFFTDRAYNKFNKTIFNLITSKLNEGIFISKEQIEEWMISESSAVGIGQSDDGPNIFFPNYEVFKSINAKRAAKIGYEIVNMITTKELEDYYEHPTYPNGPVKAVTPFPAGVLGTQTATNQVDIYSSDAYSKWFKHVTRKASLVGYSIVKGLDTTKDTKDQSLDSQSGDKKSQEEFENSLKEVIKLPVEIGDTLLMGKFKNKKVVVKTIGEDEHGLPTINGKKVVTFRYGQKAPNVFEQIVELAGTSSKCEKCNHSWELEADDSEKYLCHSCGWDSQKQEYDFDAFDSWREKMGLNEELDERGKMRPADKLRRKAARAGKSKEIARKRARTMKRRKPLSKLKKIAYKMAYRQVYAEFSEELYPGIKKADLSIAQTQVVHKNVVRKKGRIMKRAKFRFLPALRAKEVEKFEKRNEDILDQAFLKAKPVKEGRPIPMDTPNEFVYLDFKKYAYKNRGMFKRELLKHKDNGGKMFLTLSALWYKWARKDNKEFTHIKDKLKFGRALMIMMVKDDLVFSKKAWKKTSKITNLKESLPTKVTDKFKSVKSDKPSSEAEKDFNKHHKYSTYAKRGSIAEPDTIDFDDDDKEAGHQEKEKDTKKRGYEPIKEGLKELGIKDFKSLFKKMPSDLQKRVYNLKNFGQRLDKHPEGNVLKHTIMVVNRSIKEDDIDIAIAAMFHDIGKDETAGIHPKKGHITHFGHEKVSASLVKKYKKFIDDVGGNTANVFYIVKNHMRYKQLSVMTPKKVAKVKAFRAFDKLGKFSKHDKGGLEEQCKQLPNESEQDYRNRCFGYDPLTPPPAGLQRMGESKENKNMDSIEQLIGDIDNKLVEMFLPNTKTPQQLIKENINESKLLTEGGAYGHMSHPFDTDINLTFGQLKDIVNRALEGTLEFTREKTDGQALAISWRDGRLVAARNKGHLKNKGENALDIKAVADKFAGRGELEKAYNFAMKDLSDSIKSLSEKQRDKVFKQGACFMNLEVIYPTSVNVIPYGQALLVFHGTMEFNMDGIAIGENGDAARVLAGMIKQVNKDVQDNYTIQGPPVVKLPKSQNLNKSKSKYSSQISKLQKEFSLKDTDGVANYHQAWWEQWVDKNSPTSLDNKTKMGLVKRWAFMEKGFRLDKKNFSDEKTLEWAKKTDKDDQKKISKKNLMKFEQIFLGLGAEVLEFTSSALTVNPDKAVRDMKKRIDKTIKDVKKSGDPKKIEKLKLELGRLQSIGGSKKIVPNEGIVFVYGGNTFKLTGTFASVNQILGIFF